MPADICRCTIASYQRHRLQALQDPWVSRREGSCMPYTQQDLERVLRSQPINPPRVAQDSEMTIDGASPTARTRENSEGGERATRRNRWVYNGTKILFGHNPHSSSYLSSLQLLSLLSLPSLNSWRKTHRIRNSTKKEVLLADAVLE